MKCPWCGEGASLIEPTDRVYYCTNCERESDVEDLAEQDEDYHEDERT
jgi:hypothetical protein